MQTVDAEKGKWSVNRTCIDVKTFCKSLAKALESTFFSVAPISIKADAIAS